VIHSSIELASVPPHAVPFTNHLHTLLVLRSRGEEWPALHTEEFTAVPVEAEMKRVSRALDIVRDETRLRETLLWEAGYMEGHAQWG
jgi:hypothetical protein